MKSKAPKLEKLGCAVPVEELCVRGPVESWVSPKPWRVVGSAWTSRGCVLWAADPKSSYGYRWQVFTVTFYIVSDYSFPGMFQKFCHTFLYPACGVSHKCRLVCDWCAVMNAVDHVL